MPYTTITEVKANLRRDVRAQMKLLSPEERQKSDGALFARFLSLPAVTAANTILLYCGMGAEPDTAQLIPSLLVMGKKLTLPRCTQEDGIMNAHLIDGETQLIRHRYGMLEPGLDCPILSPDQIDLILVPGLAFDQHGYRLGQGGGYYDRYLEKFSGHTVALCRNRFLLEHVPNQPHDHRVDQVITEDHIYCMSPS